MRELFDRLVAEGEAGIHRLVEERTQETGTLDFKEARGANTGTLANEDRKTFAKALSAFANSAGGLLIFGVEARKVDDVDCAQAVKPISNIERFKSEAITASGQLLQPRHDGIVVEAIASLRQPGAGYLLVYVERSGRRPHRSEAAGQKQYFKRAGDSSFEMEHYDIEDAFRRNVVPHLTLEWTLDRSHTDGSDCLFFQIRFWLKNDSQVTAKSPYLNIRNFKGFDLHSADIRSFSRVAERDWECLQGSVKDNINPGRSRLVICISPNIKRFPDGYLVVNDYPAGAFMHFEFGVGSENAIMTTGSLDLQVSDLHEHAEREYQAWLIERSGKRRQY